MSFEVFKLHMRFKFERSIEMRLADEVAQVEPAVVVLGIEREPIDRNVALHMAIH